MTQPATNSGEPQAWRRTVLLQLADTVLLVLAAAGLVRHLAGLPLPAREAAAPWLWLLWTAGTCRR